MSSPILQAAQAELCKHSWYLIIAVTCRGERNPQRLKPIFIVAVSARLKPCPDEERQAEARRYVTAEQDEGSGLKPAAT